uniref:Bet v I/Major latex protein domain-containing protein n=1 Tax=Nelumbo nucifera TaxID=4432 RepID=A0A822Z4Q8_NELNU|nr:TPA_asm: hypothetical protein HUJ06_013866 [Nelumbo nucifera]
MPHESHRTEVLKGDGKGLGSATRYNYALDGNTVLSLDAKIEVLDEEKNLITFRCYDGDFLKHYKDCKFHIQVITEDHKNLVRYSMEYEKIDERVPEPTDYMEFGLKMLEGIDVLA